MISLHNILSIAKYERKTLLRSWFFRIFSILSLVVLFAMNFGLIFESNEESWMLRSIPSSIPYFNLLILNVAQAVIAVFLASDFLKRDKKLDTTEVIYMRSMTNGEYVAGKTWGNIQVFLVLNIIVLAMALVFNLLATETHVEWTAYIIYLLLVSIPTLVFIMGLSFLLMSVIRNQAITFVLVLGYIGITLFLLQAKYYYLFDYMAFNIPMMRSDIIGFGNLPAILGHRGIYFCLGMGFIFLTIFMLRRLPQSESSTIFSLVSGIIFVAAGSYFAAGHIQRFKHQEKLRAEALELNNQFVGKKFPDVLSHSISLEHKNDIFNARSDLKIQNNSGEEIRELIFNLNNGLSVSSIKINGSEAPFTRKLQLIFVKLPSAMANRSTAEVEFSYGGKIDETLCYLDIDKTTFQEKYGRFVLNVDKRYAFTEPDYLLLTPESDWYPRPGVTYSTKSISWNRTNFTDFSLEVKTNSSLTAISQGEADSPEPGTFRFKNNQPLSQISLAIGNYEYKGFKKDSVDFGVWHLKGHNYFSNSLPEIADTIPDLIAEQLKDFERTYNLEYSFRRISLVETPAQFKTFDRIWSSNQEMVQPEMILIPEKGFMIGEADFANRIKMEERWGKHRDESMTPQETQMRVLNNFISNFTRETSRPDFRQMRGGTMQVTEKTNPYFAFSLLYNFQNNIQSARWPITNRIFEAYLKSQSSDMRSSFMRNMSGMSEDEMANIALQDSTFAEILANPAEKRIIDNVIKLKGDVLFSMIQSEAGEDQFEDFLRSTLRENKFRAIAFNNFDSLINHRFGLTLAPVMDNWFREKNLPGYIFSPITAVKVKSGEQMKTMVSFSVTNFAKTYGVIKITFRLGGFGGPGGGRGGRGFGSSNPDDQVNKIIFLDSLQTKQVSYLLESDPRVININTLTSKNIPQLITQMFMRIEEDPKAKPAESETILSQPVTLAQPNEIIVDNESPGFKLTGKGQTSLLSKWILKEDASTQKYSGIVPWRPPVKWTATTNSDFYGEYIRSAYYVKSGEGDLKAEWDATITEGAYYDIYYYVYKQRDFRRRGGDEEKGEYNFIIHCDDGAEAQTLDIGGAEPGWNHLGSFYFSPGSARIELSNKSQIRTVFADAVKFVKL